MEEGYTLDNHSLMKKLKKKKRKYVFNSQNKNKYDNNDNIRNKNDIKTPQTHLKNKAKDEVMISAAW